jgi:hypothetical protein
LLGAVHAVVRRIEIANQRAGERFPQHSDEDIATAGWRSMRNKAKRGSRKHQAQQDWPLIKPRYKEAKELAEHEQDED